MGEAAVQCFGGCHLARVRTATTEGDVRAQLAGPDCPDMIVAPQNLLEKRPALQTWLAGHPFRGYYRWLVVAGNSDEFLRAFLGQVGDRLLLGPGDRAEHPPGDVRERGLIACRVFSTTLRFRNDCGRRT